MHLRTARGVRGCIRVRTIIGRACSTGSQARAGATCDALLEYEGRLLRAAARTACTTAVTEQRALIGPRRTHRPDSQGLSAASALAALVCRRKRRARAWTSNDSQTTSVFAGLWAPLLAAGAAPALRGCSAGYQTLQSGAPGGAQRGRQPGGARAAADRRRRARRARRPGSLTLRDRSRRSR